jgi:hypothetical protein
MIVLQKMVRTVAPWILIASIAVIACAARADDWAPRAGSQSEMQTPPTSGAWTLNRTSDGQADVELSIRTANSSWNYGNTESFDEFHGLDQHALDGSGATVHFSIVRDPGSFVCDGWVAHGGGGGTFTYAPSATFASELAARGMGTLTPMDQFRMTMSTVTLAYIDELRKAGYKPSATQLISMMDHGVSRRYVEGLFAIGYHPGTVDDLIRMRDHGVSLDFLTAMHSAGITPSADEAIQMRDHGVSADFVGEMKQEGYQPSIDQLIRLRDHGVSAAYVARLKKAGYHPTIDDLIRLRDAGI